MQRLLRAVDVSLALNGERDGTRVPVAVEVRRLAGDERIALERVDGSVILVVSYDRDHDATTAAVAVLERDDDVMRLSITMTAARCDAHSLSASQKTFHFPVWIAAGDDEPVYLELQPEEAVKAELQSAINACIKRPR